MNLFYFFLIILFTASAQGLCQPETLFNLCKKKIDDECIKKFIDISKIDSTQALRSLKPNIIPYGMQYKIKRQASERLMHIISLKHPFEKDRSQGLQPSNYFRYIRYLLGLGGDIDHNGQAKALSRFAKIGDEYNLQKEYSELAIELVETKKFTRADGIAKALRWHLLGVEQSEVPFFKQTPEELAFEHKMSNHYIEHLAKDIHAISHLERDKLIDDIEDVFKQQRELLSKRLPSELWQTRLEQELLRLKCDLEKERSRSNNCRIETNSTN